MTADEIYKVEPRYYWRLDWGYDDVIIFKCGHGRRVFIKSLSDPAFNPGCPYKELGACND